MLNTHLLKSWLRHLLAAKNRHGVHSPFVYRLADQVIYDRAHYPDYKTIENERRRLLADERILNITDLGAGSQYGNRKQKKVSELAGRALKSPRLAQLIYRLARDLKPATVLELGTCLGITTSYLAKAAPEARVISIEGCPEIAAVAKEGFTRQGLLAAGESPAEIKLETRLGSEIPPGANAVVKTGFGAFEAPGIHPLTGNFDELLPGLLKELSSLDLLFVDGNHRKEATLNYFNWSLPSLHEDAMVIFDDIHWSEGMEAAWTEIKAHPDVSVSIDLFHIGLVFLRKGQAKEHFKLRI